MLGEQQQPLSEYGVKYQACTECIHVARLHDIAAERYRVGQHGEWCLLAASGLQVVIRGELGQMQQSITTHGRPQSTQLAGRRR
jgi:hypothetical protein